MNSESETIAELDFSKSPPSSINYEAFFLDETFLPSRTEKRELTFSVYDAIEKLHNYSFGLLRSIQYDNKVCVAGGSVFYGATFPHHQGKTIRTVYQALYVKKKTSYQVFLLALEFAGLYYENFPQALPSPKQFILTSGDDSYCYGKRILKDISEIFGGNAHLETCQAMNPPDVDIFCHVERETEIIVSIVDFCRKSNVELSVLRRAAKEDYSDVMQRVHTFILTRKTGFSLLKPTKVIVQLIVMNYDTSSCEDIMSYLDKRFDIDSACVFFRDNRFFCSQRGSTALRTGISRIRRVTRSCNEKYKPINFFRMTKYLHRGVSFILTQEQYNCFIDDFLSIVSKMQRLRAFVSKNKKEAKKKLRSSQEDEHDET